MQNLKIFFVLVLISPLAGCISSDRNDATRLDPYLVKDINSGYLSSNPSEGVPIHQTKFVFPASDGSNGTTLWITDGTEKGTNMISGISIDKNADYSDSPNFKLFSFGDLVFFEIWYGSHSSFWRTDGSTASFMVDLNELSRNDHYTPHVIVDSNLIFSSSGSEYRYNLEEEALTRMGTYNEGMTNIFEWRGEFFFSDDSVLYHLNPLDFSRELIFDFDSENSLDEPIFWHKIRNLNNQQLLFCVGEEDYFVNTHICEEIWLTDGTSDGTRLFKENLRSSSWFSSGVGEIVDFEVLHGDIFISTNTEHLYQLHMDGNQTIVRDLFPGKADRIEELFATDDLIYFDAYDGSAHWYVSDGTYEGTKRWGAGEGYPDVIYELDNKLVLGFDEQGTYLFESDSAKKIGNENWARTIIGLTSTHLYISGESNNDDIGTELWAIQF